MTYQEAIEQIYRSTKKLKEKGKPAAYIPELSQIDPSKFGVHICPLKEPPFGIGDYQTRFSIQSIAKVFSLSLAYKLKGEKIWERVGVEPSGTKFNSLVQLESDNGIPRNPFINAGALVIADILVSGLKNPKAELLEFVKSMSPSDNIAYSPVVEASEKSVGYRNVALCNFLKSLGNIDNQPEEVLDFYFTLCSLETDCLTLSSLFLPLANDGIAPHSNEKIIRTSYSKRINAIMQTCGFYDESGEFAFRVGLPGKSGVGGGIAAVHPDKYSIAVWSPGLNAKGNSYKGMKFLEEFTTLTELSIF
ncbi:glutaminase [Jiulongibacter sediminis]|uniref:glutaminase n=1 Tax=Jiulongibacter sediminis TaxID=1605367 RepID=UPI0026EEB8AC|nr:glutaminase [Jiulongibacter sediminis]